MLGLDDLRDYTRVLRGPLPIYVRSKDLEPIRLKFPYLVNTARATGSLFVAQLDFRTFDLEPMEIEGLTITPFVCIAFPHWAITYTDHIWQDMHHGPNCDCAGFKFGTVLYMSDCVGVPDKSRALLGEPGSCELVLVDSLLPADKHVSHWYE